MLEAAKDLFHRYTSLEADFDPAVVDLYADDAVIRNHRLYPDGRVQERTLPAPVYKKLVAETMPLAKQRGDLSEYSDVTYTIESDGVEMLRNHGEFYPYAGVLTTEGEIRHVAGWTGEDHPESTEVIEMLKGALRAGAEEYQCTALIFDTLTVPPGKRKKQDAVAVALDHRDGYSIIVVHPYRLRGKKLTFQEAFTGPGERSIFDP